MSSKTKEEKDLPWSKSSTTQSQQHKVRLTCADSNIKQVVSVPPEMTLQELVDAARKLLLPESSTGGGSNGDDIELTLMGVPRTVLDLSDAASVKARSVVPHMGRIEVSHKLLVKENDSKKRSHSNNEESNHHLSIDESSSSTKKKRAASSSSSSSSSTSVAGAAEAIVDLTGSDDEEEREQGNADTIDLTVGDEALARRLQQEEQYQEEADDGRFRGQQIVRPSTNTDRDPTTVKAPGEYWIFEQGPSPYCNEEAYGKWLVYGSESKIHATWQGIRQAVASGRLHAHSAKVSTKFSVQQKNNAGPYVICVYSSQDRMDDVGNRLIRLIRYKHISYKTNDETDANNYGGGTTIKTIHWPLMTKEASLKKAAAAAAAAAAANSNAQLSTTTTVYLTLVGMQYNGWKPAQHAQLLQQRVSLVRELSNAKDKNAIRVDLLLAFGKKKKVGYLPKDQAAMLAPWLDRGLVEFMEEEKEDTISKINHCLASSNDTAMELLVRVRACHAAQEMLDAV